MRSGRILAVLGFWIAAGCAPVGPTYVETSVTAPAPKPGMGRIYFYTPKVRFGSNVQPQINLNGALVGFAVPNGFFYVDRPAGRYEATGVTAADGRIELPLAAGETKYVRAFAPSAFSVNAIHFLLVPPTEGRADMTSLIYVPSP